MRIAFNHLVKRNDKVIQPICIVLVSLKETVCSLICWLGLVAADVFQTLSIGIKIQAACGSTIHWINRTVGFQIPLDADVDIQVHSRLLATRLVRIICNIGYGSLPLISRCCTTIRYDSKLFPITIHFYVVVIIQDIRFKTIISLAENPFPFESRIFCTTSSKCMGAPLSLQSPLK